jgi:hypothetical protein
MRNVLCLALLAPVLALAAGTTHPGAAVAPRVPLQNVIPGDGGAGPGGTQFRLGPSRTARFTIGTVDTVGGTTYDYRWNDAAYRMLIQTPGKGVHALFMYSKDTDTSFLNRNMQYNYYNYDDGVWSWYDPDFMNAGIGVFAERTGYGSMDTDTNGVPVISAHHTTPAGLAPIVARDVEVGAGLFEYSEGEPTLDRYLWPYLGVGMNGYYHMAMIEDLNRQALYRSRMTSWPTWDPAASVPSPQPEPLTPSQNIATSKVPGSNKVCITWVAWAPAGQFQQNPGFYCESRDGGENWDWPVDIGFPPAFHPGSDTLPAFGRSALVPFYDRDDNLHIVGEVAPYERDTIWLRPAHGEIWHWGAARPDTWDLIRISSPVAHPDSFQGNFPSAASVICHHSVGQDDSGNLFVAWEEYDGVNLESTTTCLRADIWYSYSTDNGVTWVEGSKITDGGDVSYEFPSILNPIDSTVMVEYLIDQVAGHFVQGAESPPTENPVVVQKWPNPVGVQEPKAFQPGRLEIVTRPNPARGRTGVSYALPQAGDVSLVVYDAAGRPVQVLAAGRRQAGRYTATWDTKNAAAGVYFCTLTSGKASITKKLILAD